MNEAESAEGHDRLCGAKKRGGGTCGHPKGWGTEHPGIGPCKLHGGNTKNHVARAQRIEAENAVEQYGLARQIDPFAALLEELARTAGHVDFLRLTIAGLENHEMTQAVGGGGGGYAEDVPSVWINLYDRERKHLVAVSTACIKAGIEERRVRLAEEQGALIAKVIRGVLGELEIDPEKAAPIVRRHLALVAA